NYSRIIGRNFIVRIGFEFGGDLRKNYAFAYPLELYIRTGLGKHHFEFGAGITNIIEIENNENNFSYFFPVRIGYSYLKPGSRFYYRIGFTPIFDPVFAFGDKSFIFIPFGGISIGYTF
ncbi:MAG: hypothetical protein K8R68_12245, partial [Bacteroidales bacterium]|nr:hypothetical protein [Bacteroidales bacterium]